MLTRVRFGLQFDMFEVEGKEWTEANFLTQSWQLEPESIK